MNLMSRLSESGVLVPYGGRGRMNACPSYAPPVEIGEVPLSFYLRQFRPSERINVKTSPFQRTRPGPLHYAWVVAAITFVTLLLTAAIRATPSVLIVPFENEFHLDSCLNFYGDLNKSGDIRLDWAIRSGIDPAVWPAQDYGRFSRALGCRHRFNPTH